MFLLFRFVAGLRRCLRGSAAFRYLDKCCGRCVSRALGVFDKTMVYVPKIKILISMTQIQEGMLPTFRITLPEHFSRLLASLSFYQIDVPLDCIFPINFHIRLVYKTMVPLLLCVSLYLLSLYAKRRGNEELQLSAIDWLFTVIFLAYPSCSSVVFATFSCLGFDDGTSYLSADLSIDCQTPIHSLAQLYASIMFIWPFGVPAFYLYHVHKRRRAINCFIALEKDMHIKRDARMRGGLTINDGEEGGGGEDGGGDSATALVAAQMQAKVDECKDGTLKALLDGAGGSVGGGNSYDSVSQERQKILQRWSFFQPFLGMGFDGRASAVRTYVVAEAWPTYDMEPHLLKEEDFTLVLPEEPEVSPLHSRASSSTFASGARSLVLSRRNSCPDAESLYKTKEHDALQRLRERAVSEVPRRWLQPQPSYWLLPTHVSLLCSC